LPNDLAATRAAYGPCGDMERTKFARQCVARPRDHALAVESEQLALLVAALRRTTLRTVGLSVLLAGLHPL